MRIWVLCLCVSVCGAGMHARQRESGGERERERERERETEIDTNRQRQMRDGQTPESHRDEERVILSVSKFVEQFVAETKLVFFNFFHIFEGVSLKKDLRLQTFF